jgi:outer membrane protein
VGWALQAGSDFAIGGPYFLNVDVKKLFLNTEATGAGGLVTAHADLNPWLIGAGVGMRF